MFTLETAEEDLPGNETDSGCTSPETPKRCEAPKEFESRMLHGKRETSRLSFFVENMNRVSYGVSQVHVGNS